MTTALVGGVVLTPDGHIAEADVAFDSATLVDIGPDAARFADSVIDVAGCTVLPGLIDAHVHVSLAGPEAFDPSPVAATARAVRNLRELLAAGVTTVRDVGGVPDVVPELARAVDRGWIEGPAIIAANQIICTTGGHGTELGIGDEADGPDAMRRAVRHQIKSGATVIKVAINAARGVELTDDELCAVVDEAHRRHLRVACHASTREAVATAVRCGVDTIEHGNGVDRETAEAMARGGNVMVPTTYIFAEMQRRARSGQLDELPGDLACVLQEVVDQRVLDHEKSMPDLLDTGVTLAVGTDSMPGLRVATVVDEIETLVAYGVPLAQALGAATSGGARALGLTDRGVLTPGARADLFVVRGRVDEDLGCLRDSVAVVRGGRIQVGPGRPAGLRDGGPS